MPVNVLNSNSIFDVRDFSLLTNPFLPSVCASAECEQEHAPKIIYHDPACHFLLLWIC